MGAEKEDAEAPDALSIGSVVGGVGEAARGWNEPITELTRRVADARSGVESPLNLNVMFHVPGEVLRIDDGYVRTGRYDSRTRHLMVQATVPDSVPDDPDRFLLNRIAEAVDTAEEWARRRGMADGLPALRTILDRLG